MALPSLFSLAWSLPSGTISSERFPRDHEGGLKCLLLLLAPELLSDCRKGEYDRNVLIKEPKVRGP